MTGSERLVRWLNDVTDARLSFYMLLAAVFVCMTIFVVDLSLF